MISISKAVNHVISKSPYLMYAIHENIINVSSLARSIKPDVETYAKKPATEGAILMSLKRLFLEVNVENKIFPMEMVRNREVIVRSNIFEITVQNEEQKFDSEAIILNNIRHMRPKPFFTMTHGVFESTILASSDLEDMIRKFISKENIVFERINLSTITIKLLTANVITPGVYAYFLSRIAWYGINILETVSTTNEITIVIDSKDVAKVYEILSA